MIKSSLYRLGNAVLANSSVSKLDMVEDVEIPHDVQSCDHAEATWCIWADLGLFLGEIAMLDSHALFHRHFIQLHVVVGLGDVFRLSLAFVV